MNFRKWIKDFVFGEDEPSPKEDKGKAYIVTPRRRVRFESDLKEKSDFDITIKLLTEERRILFEEEKF